MTIINNLTKFFKNNYEKLLVISALTMSGENSLIIYFAMIILIIIMLYKNKNTINLNLNDKDNKNIKENNLASLNKNIKENNMENNIENNMENNIENNLKYNSVNNLDNKIELTIKKGIKTNIKKKSLNEINPYPNNINSLLNDYNSNEKKDFVINMINNNASIPIFNLRTTDDLDFFYNFYIPHFEPRVWSNIIMMSDLYNWVDTASLSKDDLDDQVLPVLFITKNKKTSMIEINEYLKIFISSKTDNTRSAFIQKGNEYIIIKDDIKLLLSNLLMYDLLQQNDYLNYNLSDNKELCEFLGILQSLVVIPKDFTGEHIKLDITYNNENLNTFDYFFNSFVSDSNLFQTSI